MSFSHFSIFRERDMGAQLIIKMDGKKTRITNNKVGLTYADMLFIRV